MILLKEMITKATQKSAASKFRFRNTAPAYIKSIGVSVYIINKHLPKMNRIANNYSKDESSTTIMNCTTCKK